MRGSYFSSLYFVALVSITLGVYALVGFGGYDFLCVVGVAVMPVWFPMIFVTLRLFPLEIEETTAIETELRYFLADRGLEFDVGGSSASSMRRVRMAGIRTALTTSMSFMASS